MDGATLFSLFVKLGVVLLLLPLVLWRAVVLWASIRAWLDAGTAGRVFGVVPIALNAALVAFFVGAIVAALQLRL